MSQQELEAAQKQLDALFVRADALTAGSGGVPASVTAELRALKVTMEKEAAAA
eukprot:COSAG04_NODE_6872_length_1237_cov_4.207381_3_plen_52_part_01